MPKPSKRRKKAPIKKMDPIIAVALIALVGTIITAVFASPAINKLIEGSQESNSTITPAVSQISTITVSETGLEAGSKDNFIGLDQTVTGTLYFDEAGIWVFKEGPAVITVILDVGPFGDALIILQDMNGIERAYVDTQSGSEERLVNFTIPTDGRYTILIRNTHNTQVDYTLTVEGGKSPVP
jgi:hypothetical protein